MRIETRVLSLVEVHTLCVQGILDFDHFHMPWESACKSLSFGWNWGLFGSISIGSYSTLSSLDPKDTSGLCTADTRLAVARLNVKVLSDTLAMKTSNKPLVVSGITFLVGGMM